MDAFIFYTVKCSVCLSAGFLLYYLLLRKETFHRFQRFVLLGIVVASLIVPLIKVKVDPAGIGNPVQRLERKFVGEPVKDLPAEARAPVIQQSKESRPTDYTGLLYILGAMIQVVLVLGSVSRIILLIGKSKKLNHNGFRLVIVNKPMAPFSFGRYIVLSETDYREHAGEVILHEQTHLMEKHGFDLLFAELILIMTWYNPASWLLRRELRQIHEFEADRQVLRQGVDPSDYQLLLVRTVAGESRFKLANQFNQNHIKTRIAMMNKGKSKPGAIFKALLFIPLLALMVQVFAQKEISQSPVTNPGHARSKYLELSPDQLKLLGFEINSTGLFYKNIRGGKAGKGTLCLYFTADTYSANIVLKEGEKITGNSTPVRILRKQAITGFDYYPVVVTGFDGFRTLDMSAAMTDPNQKLLPVQVNMASLNLGKRADTLIFWFMPTESLKHLLVPVANTDEYLQACPAGNPK